MPMKEWITHMKPARLIVVLLLSILYFLVLLGFSHITHALTLLVVTYHMLCNIISLVGCIITVKYMNNICSSRREAVVGSGPECTSDSTAVGEVARTDAQDQKAGEAELLKNEGRLRNTFGWTRIDVVTQLIMSIFLASLSFSLLIEAMQTLIHIDHQDTMHFPLIVLLIAVAGLVLNGIAYVLIGGYTHSQISFLIAPQVTDERPTAMRARIRVSKHKEVIRDICGYFFVIACTLAIYFVDNNQVTKYIDPAVSIVSCVLLLVLSYPYMKESCLILLQTIPATIEISIFKENLLKTFPGIVNVHDLHIWQLTTRKYVSTVHLIFQNPHVYELIIKSVDQYFHDQGICIVTIQPEFVRAEMSPEGTLKTDCLVYCHDKTCSDKVCCTDENTLDGSAETEENK